MTWDSGYLHPYQNFFWTWANEKLHSGIDLPADCGTPMTAAYPGKVIVSSKEPWGGQVSVASTLAGSPFVYTYLHGKEQSVNVGDTVTQGQLVGYSGQPPPGAGYGSGCHIHFEVNTGTKAPYVQYDVHNAPQDNHPIDPVPLLAYDATGAIQPFAEELGVNASGTPTGNNTPPAKCTPPTGGNVVNPVAWAQYAACLSATTGGSIGQQVTAGIGSAFSSLFGGFSLNRVLKFAAGTLMIVSAVIILILPDAADVALSAAGAPQLGEAVRQGLSHPLKRGTPGAISSTVRRTVSGRAQEKAQATRAYANYQTAARQYQEKRQADVIKEFQKRQAPQTTPLRGKLKNVRNPMTNEEIRQAQAKPTAAPILPTPQRAPKAPPESTIGRWWRQGGEAISRYNRASAERTRLRKQGINPGPRLSREELQDRIKQEELTRKREAKYQQPGSNAPSIEDIMKDLRKPKNE